MACISIDGPGVVIVNSPKPVDDLNGEAGTNKLDAGNLASTVAGTIKSASISAGTSTTPPAPAPVIDWEGKPCDGLGGADPASWLSDFVTELGQTAAQLNPNSQIRIKL